MCSLQWQFPLNSCVLRKIKRIIKFFVRCPRNGSIKLYFFFFKLSPVYNDSEWLGIRWHNTLKHIKCPFCPFHRQNNRFCCVAFESYRNLRLNYFLFFLAVFSAFFWCFRQAFHVKIVNNQHRVISTIVLIHLNLLFLHSFSNKSLFVCVLIIQ